MFGMLKCQDILHASGYISHYLGLIRYKIFPNANTPVLFVWLDIVE